MSDAGLDVNLRNLLAWSNSVGGLKTKPSQLQSGIMLLARAATTCRDTQSSPAHYSKILTALKVVLGNLAAKTNPPSATKSLQRVLKAVLELPRVRLREAQHAEIKVRHCLPKRVQSACCCMATRHNERTISADCMLVCCAWQARMVIEQCFYEAVAGVYWQLVGSQGGQQESEGACCHRLVSL